MDATSLAAYENSTLDAASNAGTSQDDINMPGYDEFADHLTPEEFIRTFWKDASNEMRGCMIAYIFEHPFDGCFTYIAQWLQHIQRTHGVINPSI